MNVTEIAERVLELPNEISLAKQFALSEQETYYKLKREYDEQEAKAYIEISNEEGPTGKPKYSNAESRKAAVTIGMSEETKKLIEQEFKYKDAYRVAEELENIFKANLAVIRFYSGDVVLREENAGTSTRHTD